AEPVADAPMHLRIDDPLRALVRTHQLLGRKYTGSDGTHVGPNAVKNPPTVGAEERAGGARPEMLRNVGGVEFQSGLLVGARDHPDEGDIRQPGPLVAAADVRMSAGKPDLLHVLAVLAWFVDPCRCREGAAPLVDGHGVQAVLDVW